MIFQNFRPTFNGITLEKILSTEWIYIYIRHFLIFSHLLFPSFELREKQNSRLRVFDQHQGAKKERISRSPPQ